MAFNPVARIDLSALRHNLSVARRIAGGSRLMAVIKANAYGHGLERVAAALDEADALAVARVGEGIALRDAGVDKPVVVLEGCFDRQELEEAIRRRLELVVHQPEQLALLREATSRNALSVWLKVESGMHRLGFEVDEAIQAFEALQQMPVVAGTPRLMTHLANADTPEDGLVSQQLSVFHPLLQRFPVEYSIANSAALLALPETHADWQRPGLMLYGASPFSGRTAAEHDLRPVMTLGARIIAIKQLQTGDRVGYGSTWTAPEAMRLAVVCIGYGDGYPREVPSGTPVLINGRRAELVGRVSMDMLTVDLRGHDDARIGDPVVLWGEGLPAEEIAEAAGTIPYTLFCGITARVTFIEVDEG